MILVDNDLTPGDERLYRWLLERPVTASDVARELRGTVEARSVQRASDDLAAMYRAGIASLGPRRGSYHLRAIGESWMDRQRGPT